jgi:CO/xanthine dehydrogenase FAD-binding subunit
MMIPFDLEYHLPQTAEEAVSLFTMLDSEKKKPLYYAGGTEIITFCRQQKIGPGALIDLKKIPETTVFEKSNSQLVIGANLNLNRIAEDNKYPLLSVAVKQIADRTVRNRLTLGGNICGRLPYREALLPFLLADAEVVLAGPEGRRTEQVTTLFDKRLKLGKGELLVQLKVVEDKLNLPFYTRRRVKQGPVDYPLYHLAGTREDEELKFSVAGLCAFTFRSKDLEQVLIDQTLKLSETISGVIDKLPGAIREDERGSAAYRKALFEKDLELFLTEMGEK